ncbi:MAG: glycosyltransferase family 2 protein [Pseudanabaena sp.]
MVVDDGSTDGTWEWLQYQKKVIALRQSNLGKCWAVNRAFQIAKGKYIRFLDSDDWIASNANDQQFQIASTSNADVVVGGYQGYSEEEILLNEVKWIECDDFLAQQLGECNSSHYSAYLFRKDFIEGIPHRPDFTWRDDRLFVIEVAMKKPKIAVYSEPSLCHRHHSQDRLQFSRGMRSVATNLQHLTIYKKCLSQLSEQNELTVRRKKAAIKILWSLAHWIAYTHLDEACEVVDWIYQLDPSFQPPELGLLGQFYNHLGFACTERLLKFRRNILKLFGYYPHYQKLHQFPIN